MTTPPSVVTSAQAMSSVTYYDGLGRPVQSIDVGASPANRDIVGFIEYDRMGRADSVSHLPYVLSNANYGQMITNPLSGQQAYYQNKFSGDPDRNYAYSTKVYDAAGLVSQASGPGASSHDHPMLYEYRKNVSGDGIKKYEMASNNQSLSYVGSYPLGKLTVVKSGQQGKASSYTYTNASGQVVAKEVRTEDDRRVTYYVYDDLGRQRYVIPPIQDSLITAIGIKTLSTLTKYSYYTEYDDHGRVVKQYVPGAEPVFSLYDKRGRLVLTQDGNQRPSNLWSFTKYDALNRPVMTGVYTGGTFDSHKAALQQQSVFGESRGTTLHGYTNVTYPVVSSAANVYVVSYYDDYAWLAGVAGNYAFDPNEALGSTPADAVVGLPTGTRTKVLDDSAPAQWLLSVSYYDARYRSIQSIADLYPSGREIVSNAHDFTGAVTRTRVKQTVNNTSYGYNKWFDFDPHGRLRQVRQQIDNDAEVVIAAYAYDEMGRVAEKDIHNGSETTEYEYSVAGANTGQHSPSFSYDLWFDKVPNSSLTPRHDGNLAHVTWGNNASADQKGYSMTYDPFGQMTSATYRERSGSQWNAQTKFAERGITYDRNGNIRTLQRTGNSSAVTDHFTYHYDGNQLARIGTGTPFEYDANGNMTRDGQTGVQIEYNLLNLPRRIFANSEEIRYIYSASGEKLAAQTASSLTYYRSVMVYEKVGSDPENLSYMLHPEGIVSKSNTGYIYRYFKTDHVGSTRVMLSANGTNSLIVDQRTDFYPFGLSHESNNTLLNASNRYLFSGKELQNFSGSSLLNLYDFHARYYNPTLGRWFNIDPALQFGSPYVYAANSPMMFVDPDGRIAWIVPVLVAAAKGAAISASFYTLSVALSPGGFDNWSWKDFGYSALNGAISGTISHINPLSIDVGGGLSFSVNPSFMVSSDGLAFGVDLGVDLNVTSWMRVGMDFGYRHYSISTGTERYHQNMFSFGYGVNFGSKKVNGGLYSTSYMTDDGTSQRVGGMEFNWGKFNARYENDEPKGLWPFTDGGDRYRSAAAQIGWGDWNIRMNLFTGSRDTHTGYGRESSTYPNGYYTGGDVDDYRMGALSIGYKNFRIGLNSERIRHTFQTTMHNFFNIPTYQMLNNHWNLYYYWGSNSRYSLWF